MKPLELMNPDELYEEFADLDQIEACQYLEELGRDLPTFPDELAIDANLVPGCQSRVWLVLRPSANPEDAVEILADSDALVVKGLVFIVLCLFAGKTPRQILDVDYQSFFERLGLGRLILPQRKNGLFSMVRTVRVAAAEIIGEAVDDDNVSGRSVNRPVAESHADQDNSSLDVDVPGDSAGDTDRRRLAAPTRNIDSVRFDFPILSRPLPSGQRVVYLDSGASAQKPNIVIAKEREVEEQYFANAFRGRYYFGSRIDEEIEGAREKIRNLIGAASTDEIVFTSGTTMSINMVAQAWGRRFVNAGDEILLNDMEHHANLVPWQQLAAERGARLRFIPLTADGRLDLSRIDSLITARTKLVSVTGMSNVLGTINPIDVITRRARETGTCVVVDGAQSVSHLPVDVTAANIDFLAFSGHKLYGPTGIGVLYGRRELLESMDPFLGGGHMIERVTRDRSTWAPPPAKFEAGTLPIVQAIALGTAIDYVQSIGFAAMHRHEQALLETAHRELLQIPGLTIYGPPTDAKGAIVSFSIDGISTEDLAWRLDRAGVFTRHGHHCTMPLHDHLGIAATTRASFGIYNTLDDVDVLVNAVRAAVDDVRSA